MNWWMHLGVGFGLFLVSGCGSEPSETGVGDSNLTGGASAARSPASSEGFETIFAATKTPGTVTFSQFPHLKCGRKLLLTAQTNPGGRYVFDDSNSGLDANGMCEVQERRPKHHEGQFVIEGDAKSGTLTLRPDRQFPHEPIATYRISTETADEAAGRITIVLPGDPNSSLMHEAFAD
jgi:hypothetical protein